MSEETKEAETAKSAMNTLSIGALDEMLIKVAKTYDKEVEQSIKQLISLIEPMMILIMAVIIGFIVVSMLLAIFSANDISF